MAFSLSGSTITQSGTDTNLSGLAGIAGVVTTIFGSGGAIKTVYNVGNLNLVYNNLTIDPRIEELRFGSSSPTPNMYPANSAAVLQVGIIETINGQNYGTSETAISFSRNDGNTSALANSLYLPFGTFSWYAGRIRASQPFGMATNGGAVGAFGTISTATGTISKWATLEIFGTPTGTPFESNQLFFNSNGVIVNGLTVIGHGVAPPSCLIILCLAPSTPPSFNLVGLGGVTYTSANRATQMLQLRGLKGTALSKGANLWWGSLIRVINTPLGSALPIIEHNVELAHSAGLVEVTQELEIIVKDSAASPISGAKVYIRDTNNGDRRDYNATYTYLADRVYSALSNPSGFVEFKANGGILTAVVAKTALVLVGVDDTGANKKDRRSKLNNITDTFDVKIITYIQSQRTTAVSMQADNAPVMLTVELLPDTSITETTKATVDAYTAIDTSAKLYDRAKSWLYDNYTGQTATIVTRSGTLINAGSYNVTIDATAASVFSLAGNTLTLKASTYTGDMTTTGLITLANGATFVGTRTDANGTFAPPKTVSITGLTTGSRLRVYNNTTTTEVVNQIVSGTSYTATYNEGTGYSTGNTLTITVTWQSGTSAKLPFSTQVVVGSTGWSALVNQQDDTVYNGIGVDGSTVTEFVPDYPNVQVDISDPNGQTSADRLYSWFVYTTTTESGIRNWFGGIVAEDAANFRVITAILNLKIDNISAAGVEFTGGHRLYRDDNATPLVSSTSGGGSITLFAGKVYTSIVSTSSPVITGDISQVPAAVQSGMTAQGYTSARAVTLDTALTTPKFLALK